MGAERHNWERKQLIRIRAGAFSADEPYISHTQLHSAALPFTFLLSRLLTSKFSHTAAKQKLSRMENEEADVHTSEFHFF